jgi:L-lactate dehydrogenase complex protein LldF
VRIDLHKLLLLNRRDSVEEQLTTRAEKVTWFLWKRAMLNRRLINTGGGSMKNFVIRTFFGKAWGSRRELPTIAPKSFNQLWREREGV